MPFVTRIKLQQLPEDSGFDSLPVVKHLASMEYLPISQPVTFFVGENGAGKSTLLEAVAVVCGFNPEGGSRNFSFSTQETHSGLYQYLKISKTRFPKDGFFLRAESFYNVATEIDKLNKIQDRRPLLDSYGGKSLHEQSHGESFLSLVLNRFGGNGLYILDEPEAALSPMNQMVLLAAIGSLVKKGSQFLIATHSPILMAFPDAQIYQLSEDAIQSVEYRQTDHYQITKQFMDSPERMVKYLLKE